MPLQIHNLRPARGAKKPSKRVGRGNASGHGTTACRGGKGQTARSGGSRGIQRRSFKFVMQSTPKLRGFHGMNKKTPEVYLGDLEKNYKAGETVDVATLKEKKLIGINDRSAKILNKGELNKKLTVVGVKYTKVAGEKIVAAGGELK